MSRAYATKFPERMFQLDVEPAAAAQAEPVHEILEPSGQKCPLVFSSPHSGSAYPPQFVSMSRLDPLALRRSEDVKVDLLFRSVVDLGAPLLRALFPRAELKMHADDHAYWHDDSAMMKVEDPARRQMFFADGRTKVALYRERMQLFTGGEVFPGVTTVPLPGHTPGHTGFLIASGNASLLIWGDIVHVQELQVARPEVTMAVDVDPARAVTTRRAILERAAADRQAIAGMHIHFPAFAHVVRDGAGYRLLPDAWSMDLDGDVAQVKA